MKASELLENLGRNVSLVLNEKCYLNQVWIFENMVASYTSRKGVDSMEWVRTDNLLKLAMDCDSSKSCPSTNHFDSQPVQVSTR